MMKLTNNPRDTWAEGLFSGNFAERKVRERVLAGAQALRFLLAAQEHMDIGRITRAQLAEAIGVSKSQVSRWFRAANGLNVKSMFLIASGLGYDLEMRWTPLKKNRPAKLPGFLIDLPSSSDVSTYTIVDGSAEKQRTAEAR